MFQSDFDDISGFGHHRNKPSVSKVKNRARMTLFYTRIIPTFLGCSSYYFLLVELKS